jgi:hypothetical protein
VMTVHWLWIFWTPWAPKIESDYRKKVSELCTEIVLDYSKKWDILG